MQNFELYTPTKIIFGKDKETQIGKYVKEYANKVLLHYGKGHIKKTGLYDDVIESLEKENIEVFELGGVKPNPEIELVYKGIDLVKKNNIGFILAVGGGSVIDSAKAIAMGSCYDKDVWDFYFTDKDPKEALPIATILTIPAAGSEMSKFSVITNGEYKIGYGNDILRPKFSILNPELTFTLPKWQTASGIVDIMAHVMERYFTEEKYVDLSDRMCEGLLKTVMKYAKTVLCDPENYEARSEIMWAASIAHNGLLGKGRIEDWASHRIQMPFSAKYDLTHGAGLAIIFPAWIKYVSKMKPDICIKFFNRVFNIDYDYDNPEAIISKGINELESFYKSLGMPVRLKDVNIEPSQEELEELAKVATVKGPQGNLVKLYKEDVVEIYNLAL